MDPLTALGLGANVIQFIDFAWKLIGVGREAAESQNGATVEHTDLENVTRNLFSLNERVANSVNESSFSSHAAYDLGKLVRGCSDVAEELLDALEKLRANDRHGKWKGLVAAFKTIWSKGQIDSLRERLNQYRATMQSALIVSLNEQVHQINGHMRNQLYRGTAADRFKLEVLDYVRRLGSRAENPDGHIIALFSAKLSRMTELERDTYCKSRLLAQLGFQQRMEREYRIAAAHKKTFRWIFRAQYHEARQDKRWSNFVS